MAELPEAEREGLYQEYQKTLASRLLQATASEESQRLVCVHQLCTTLSLHHLNTVISGCVPLHATKVILSCSHNLCNACLAAHCHVTIIVFAHVIVATFQVQLVYEACHVRLAMLAAAHKPGLDVTTLGSASAAGFVAVHSDATAPASAPGANQAPEPMQPSAEQKPCVRSHSTLMQVI